MKRKLFLVLLILLIIPLVSTLTFGSGRFGLGLFGTGEVISSDDTSSSSGGGGSSCVYNWECTNWFPPECPESGKQERICANKGTCTGTTGMPEQTQTCEYTGQTEPLFDIFLTFPDKDKETCAGEKIGINIRLENYGKIELLDAFMTYWIIDKNNTLISELKDTRSVQDKINFDIAIKIPLSAKQGTYRLYAQIDYDKNKTAVAGGSFEIVEGTQCKVYSFLFKSLDSTKTFLSSLFLSAFASKQILFIVGGIILLIVIILIPFIIKNKKKKGDHAKYKKRIRKNLKKIVN